MNRVSNMNASVSPRKWGWSGAAAAWSKVGVSGPCPDMQLCRLAPPGAKPSAFASYVPKISPMYSFMMLRWKYGGRDGWSGPVPRGGKRTKTNSGAAGGGGGGGSTGKSERAGG